MNVFANALSSTSTSTGIRGETIIEMNEGGKCNRSKENTSSQSCKNKEKMDVETDSTYRAVHQIRLSALIHNYNLVEAAAAQQRCNVIVVVKADGYGHGAIQTALHMADKGADAFAVATLEEGILLRKALDATSKKLMKKKKKQTSAASSSSGAAAATPRKLSGTTDSVDLTDMFRPPATQQQQQQQQSTMDESDAISVALSTASVSTTTSSITTTTAASSRRAALIRILVLGPPVGCPLCFDDYCHYSIECMITGPEVAAALIQWVANPLDHKRRLVERVAQETKQEIGDFKYHENRYDDDDGYFDDNDDDESKTVLFTVKNSATLSGTTGKDLVKEYKQFVLNQKKAAQITNLQVMKSDSTAAMTTAPDQQCQHSTPTTNTTTTHYHEGFSGIEAAALNSRKREKAAAATSASNPMSSTAHAATATTTTTIAHQLQHSKKRRLRWHAVVDTGMGRLGFKTESPSSIATSDEGRRDTVEILQELVNAELVHGAPIGKERVAVAYVDRFCWSIHDLPIVV